MKRLKLEDFKAKNTEALQAEKIDELLGQVLGNCHDKPKEDDKGFFDTMVDLGGEFVDHLAKRLNLKPVE